MLLWAQNRGLKHHVTDHLVAVLMQVDGETLRREAVKHSNPKRPNNGG